MKDPIVYQWLGHRLGLDDPRIRQLLADRYDKLGLATDAQLARMLDFPLTDVEGHLYPRVTCRAVFIWGKVVDSSLRWMWRPGHEPLPPEPESSFDWLSDHLPPETPDEVVAEIKRRLKAMWGTWGDKAEPLDRLDPDRCQKKVGANDWWNAAEGGGP